MRKLLVIASLISGVLISFPCQAGETIKIGLLGPMTGALSAEGKEMRQVVELLASEINESGGLLGKKVQLVIGDDRADPKIAADTASMLVARGIIAVIGSYASSITEAVQNIFDRAGILQITNASTAVELTEKGFKRFFRTCPRDDEQGRAMASLAEDLGSQRIAIIHDNSIYSRELAENAKRELNKKKIQVVFSGEIIPGKMDYSGILKEAKQSQPDAVLFTGYYPETAVMLRQKREMKWDVPFIGGDASMSPNLTEMAGKDATEGYIFFSLPRPENLASPEAKEFLKTYQKKYGNYPTIYALLAGDAFRLIVFAIQKTRSTDPAVLAKYLHESVEQFPGFTGVISFDNKGDREGQIFLDYEIDSGGNAELRL